MSGRITPAVRALEQAGVSFKLLEYDYHSTADDIVVNGGRRGLQVLLAPADLIVAASAKVVALKS